MEENSGLVVSTDFSGEFSSPIKRILDRVRLGPAHLKGKTKVIIKPNLVEAVPPPITTPAALCAVLIDELRLRLPGIDIAIGEGVGSLDYETDHAFRELGYAEMAKEKGVELIDLNHAELTQMSLPQCKRWPTFYLPKIVMESFIVSVPVLKAHSLAGVTLTMKNMMGTVPPLHFQAGGHWKKSAFHEMMHESVLDMCRYRTPDLTVLDATVGMSQAHLWGPTCEPPVNKLACSFDPVAIDAYGATLLGRDWKEIKHIKEADGELGSAQGLRLVEL
ncbi:MAG: DUF362 domain-containing protein [Deltaproteobacteria bacterium]|nr:DUF362 domain-containing protein [Deltaproteobacteria bacterium]